MWIDETDSATRHDIRVEHVLEESRLPHTRLPDDIDVTSTVDRLYAESLRTPTEVGYSDRSIGFLRLGEIVWWFELASRYPVDTRSFHIDRREVDDTCELSCREEGTIF